ncbi:hypothetical protein NC652_014455 [Populus alba x Populus x berolinensis]|nr:hypothetical protein NC652_014455 [Populus alba x Populus x berolinensis]
MVTTTLRLSINDKMLQVLGLNHLAWLRKQKKRRKKRLIMLVQILAKGISHVYEGEEHCPSELFCDVLGKCTHRIMAEVLHEATNMVSEVIYDVVDEKKEMDLEAKEEVKGLYWKQKEVVHWRKIKSDKCKLR